MITRYRSNPKIISNGGFFYRSNLRGKAGLDWGKNLNLPIKIRECRDAINLSKELVEGTMLGGCITVEIHQKSIKQDRNIFKGTFTIPIEKVLKWVSVNGYYLAQSGRRYLAVPVSLWSLKEKGEDKFINQPKLFENDNNKISQE